MSVTLIKWRDIPSQLVRGSGRKSEKLMLSNRFQEAIDRTAMREGVHDSDGYLEGWQRVPVDEAEYQMHEALEKIAQHLEENFDEEKIEALVQAGGWSMV
jgi:hypothetical protein